MLESIKDSGDLVGVADLTVIDNQTHEKLPRISGHPRRQL